MWGGKIFAKHRDYLHGSFIEHELANGGSYKVREESVMVDTDPITGSAFEPARLYYLVDLTLHDGDAYIYLVPAEADKSQPNAKRVRDTITEYMRHPVPGGRNFSDYIADDEDNPLTPFSVDSIVPSVDTNRHRTGKFSIDSLLS